MSASALAPDHLRPPLPTDPSAPAYKEWLHLNVLDHGTGVVAIVNVSLHGAPTALASRAVGTALADVPGHGWVGNLDVRGIDTAALGLSSIGLPTAGLAVDTGTGAVHAAARLAPEGLSVQVSGTALGPAIIPGGAEPFGSGWLGWYAVPRVSVDGTLTVAGRDHRLAGASGYCDHNWGRWHWGDDAGWEWGTFLAPAPGPAVVLSRLTDRRHTRSHATSVELRDGPRRRRFGVRAVTVEWGEATIPLGARLPGAMAALHSDRRAPRLPASLRVHADDGYDRVTLTFHARNAAQLVLADPAVPGYAFLHELVGSFACSGRLGGRAFAAVGLAVVERVE